VGIWQSLQKRAAQNKAGLPPKDKNNNEPPPVGAIFSRLRPFNFYGLFRRGDHTLQNSEIIFAATSRLSNTLSALPIKLYKGLEPVQSELADLISTAPNPNMTSCNFFKTMEALRDTTGNAYALKVLRPDYTVERLNILDPAKITPLIDEVTGDLWYRVNTEKGDTYWHNWHIIHVQFVSTNGYVGINPVSVLFDTLDYARQIDRFSVEQIQKGINATVCLEAPANLGDTQKKKMVDTFTAAYRETGGNVLLLESGVTAKALNLSPVDTKLFEVEKIKRSKVALVYNLPPHLLGDYSNSPFSNVEQQTMEFMLMTMLPIATMYEQELNRKLLSSEERREGYAFKFTLDNNLRVDASTRAEVNFKGVRSGWKLINEARQENGYAPVADGDKPLLSRDLIPLDVIVNKTELLLKGGRQNGS